jgi:hypothetical protein
MGKMKVQVLSIQPAIAPNSHEVLLSVGADRHKFIFTTEVNQVGDQLLQTTHGDRLFSEVFRFNQRVAMNVSQLVVKSYNKEAVQLPVDVGNFVTPEEALSKQKPFENSRLLEETGTQISDTSDGAINPQLPEEVNQEIRQRAIALLEKLPDNVLDEAVKFLESLSVKASFVE